MENCHCTNAICTPSRASILTGQYSHTNGVRTLFDSLNPEIDTYPRVLSRSGYETALFGKWHLHTKPGGFGDYCVLPNQGKYFNPEFIDKGCEWSGSEYPDGDMHKGYVTDIITDMCIEWMEKRDKSKPFALMCHHKAPHDFFEYHPRDEHLFDGVEIPEPENLWEDKFHRSDGSRDYGTTVSDSNLRRNYVKMMTDPDYPTGQLDVSGMNSKQRTKAAYQKYLKDYLRTVKAIDDNVGRLLDYLDKNGLAGNTVVIYTSDQGMFLGEHDYIDKRWIFDEAMRMPLVVRYPAEIPAGAVMDSIVSNVDFAPVLLDYAGIKTPVTMQGESFRDVLRGDEPADWPNIVYNRYWMHMAHHDNPAHYGIRTKEYKLVYFYGLPLDASGAVHYPTPEGWEFYDLKKDPGEERNAYDDPAYTDVIAEIKVSLKKLKDDIGDEDTRYPEMLELKKGLY